MSIKTRAGLVPSTNEVQFTITTEMAEQFLAKKFEMIVKFMNDSGVSQEPIEPRLLSLRFSNKFHPFWLTLPMSVLKSKGGNKKNSEELSMFNPGRSEGQAKFKDMIYDYLSCLMYDTNDVHAWYSSEWRSVMGVRPNTVHFLKEYRKGKIERFNKGRDCYVTLIIDPIRLFHDMLTNMDNEKEDFRIYVSNVNNIKTGNDEYEVARTPNKKNKKNDRTKDKYMSQLSRMISGK